MSPRWRYFLPGYLLTLPNTFIGLILVLLCGARRFRWSQGCLECEAPKLIGDPLGQTWGWLIAYKTGHSKNKAMRVHERVHVVQGMIGGPLFMIAYALCFAFYYACRPSEGWYKAYRRNPFEIQAYATAPGKPGDWGYPV